MFRGAILLILFLCIINSAFTQYNWKLEKQKDGITIYLSDIKDRSYKAVRVECTFNGTYAKLISVLTNISRFSEWIYHNKASKVVKQYSAYDFVYYSETKMPFPISNRDLAIRLQIKTDSLPKFLTINGRNVEGMIPEIPGHVRVSHYKANWKVTMPTPKTIHISYIVEIDPGGSLPAWVANSFADKGPFETFSSLGKELKR